MTILLSLALPHRSIIYKLTFFSLLSLKCAAFHTFVPKFDQNERTHNFLCSETGKVKKQGFPHSFHKSTAFKQSLRGAMGAKQETNRVIFKDRFAPPKIKHDYIPYQHIFA